MASMQASGNFITESNNVLNNSLTQFQQMKIKDNDPRRGQYYLSQNEIITKSMKSLKSQVAEVRNLMKFWESDSFIFWYKTKQDETMANFESTINRNIAEEMEKLQLNMSIQFNKLTPQFKQLGIQLLNKIMQ
jgi:hypothetical protein